MPPPSIWRDIADDLRRRVEAGEWEVGERIPSVRELMAYYDTPSQGALVRAIAALADEGVLLTDPLAPRRGTRVRARHKFIRPIDQQLASPVGDDGRTFEAFSYLVDGDLDIEIAYDREDQPSQELAALLGAGPLLRRTFRYLVHGTPHQVMRSWMLDHVASSAGLHSPADEVVGRFTEQWLCAAGIKPHHVSITIESRLPTDAEAVDLAMPRALPIMVRKRTVQDVTGQAVETNTSLVVADQIVYEASFDLRNPC